MKTKKMLLLFFMFLTGVMNVSAQTPYAVFEPDPLFEDGRYGTLYLKADGLNGILEAGGTKVYYPPTASGTSWTDFQIVSKITSVVIEESFAKARPTSCSGWFSGMKNLNRIQGIEYLNTENVTNMSSMFNGCSKLTIPDLSGFNTANVTNMSYMFYGCPYPGNDWTTFNTGNVTKMHFMFGCTGLSAVYMSRLNLQKVTDMESMFDGCTNLETVNMSGCNTQNVTDMSSMFNGCSKLTTVNMSGCKTENVTDMSSMFNGCSSLASLDVSGFNTANVTNMSSMFNDCSNLRSLDVSGFNTANVTDMSEMFCSCDLLPSIDVSGFNTANVTDMSEMFKSCLSLTSLDLSSFTFSSSISTSSMLSYCTRLKSLTIPSSASYLNDNACTGVGSEAQPCLLYYPAGFLPYSSPPANYYYQWKSGYFKDFGVEDYAVLSTDHRTLTFYRDDEHLSRSGTVLYLSPYYEKGKYPAWSYKSSITSVVFDSSFANAHPKSCAGWFSGMTNLTSITGLEYLNTENVYYMDRMFNGCSSLTNLDLSGFNTANVTDMSYMFDGCSSLRSLNLSWSNMNSSTLSMELMFWNCSSLTSLDLSGFNFTFSSNQDNLLEGCSGLKTLIVPESAKYFENQACLGVGTSSAPCTLIFPEGSSIEEDFTVGNRYFTWCGGYFRDVDKPYAILSNNNTKLTFYYDPYFRYSTVFMVDGTPYPEWLNNNATITNVYFNSSFSNARPTNCEGWFLGMDKLTSISGINYLNTTEVTNMEQMFKNCSSLTSLDVSKFDTGKVTNMREMFNNCSGLTSLDVSRFNTANVIKMNGMFENCYGLTTLDVSGFNTEKVTMMSSQFEGCSGLTSLDLSGFTFKNETNAIYILNGCSSLKLLSIPATAHYLVNVDCVGVGTQSSPCTLIYPPNFPLNITSSGDGWYQWKGGYFKDADLEAYAVLSSDHTTLTFYYDNQSGFRTGSVYGMNVDYSYPGWYDSRATITNVEFDPSFADARPTSCYRWFCVMTNLTSITGIQYLNTENVKNMQLMFNYCSKLTSLDVSGFDTRNVLDMHRMFWNCSSLTTLNVSGFNTENMNDISRMFEGCSSLTSLDLSGFSFTTATESNRMLENCTRLQTLIIPSSASYLDNSVCNGVGTEASPCTLIYPDGFTLEGATQGTDYFLWKGGYFKLPEKEAYTVLEGSTLTFYYDNLKSSHTGTVYNLNTGSANPEWYSNRSSVTTVVFDDSFVGAGPTSCYCWFYGMSNLTSITGIGNLKTDNVKNMRHMFYNCSSLTSLDVSSFNTANVTEMQYMFWGCSKLTSLDVSNFNTANVTVMSNMFNGCSKLASLDLSNFNTAKVIDMSSMFYNCYALTSLDLSNFNTAKVNYMSSMFYNCSALTSLDLSSFNTANVTVMDYMFNGCSKLTSLDLSSFTFPSPSSTSGTSSLLRGCSSLETLTIPSTAGKLSNDAFWGVGTANDPCTLICPAGFTPEGANQYDGYIQWKRGYFTDVLLGDANGDGAISVADVMITVCNVRGMEMSSFNQKNADVNQDGQITITDVMLIVKMVASGSSSAPRNAHQSMSDAMEVTAKGSELTLHLTGTGSYTASQMMLTLPEGCRLESAQMVSSRDNGHSVRINELGNGQYRVVIYGAYGMPFRNSCTDLVRLQVAGNHRGDVSLSDIQVVDAQTNTFLLSDVSGIATGIDSIGSDVSDDGDWYTIQGQKVATPTRGVYIHNGRKVVVR